MHPSGYIWVGGRRIIRQADHGIRLSFGGKTSIIEKDGVGVIILLKCASRSMLALRDVRRVVVGEDKLPDEIHAFVRDPIERLRSAYQFFRKRPPVEYRGGALEWEQFIDYVLDGRENVHWKPASMTIDEVPAEVTVHRFEDLAEKFPLGKLPRKNKSREVGSVDVAYRADEVKNMYAGDYRLRVGQA